MTSIQDIQATYRSGEITREEYWTRMQERHLGLREYQQLIASTPIKAIEVAADELRVVTDAGIRMVWHPEDLRTAPNVLINTGEYEPVESAALLNAAKGAKVIFDIGSNIGYYSLHWAGGLADGGSIHAFEPVPTTYQRLARNVELNGLGGTVRTNNQGVGDKKATLTFHLPAFSGSGAASMMNLHPEEQSVEVRAQIDTLDNYFAAAGLDTLDLAKIDVEGAELMVIQGGMKTIETHKPLLFLELLRKWSKPFGYHPNDVIELLRGIGYRCYASDGSGLAEFEVMDDETVQTNFFFAHADRHGDWLKSNGLA